jgi:mRNA interferase MazF
MTRATVVWVDLSDASPPEMGKRRPAIIVSNSAQNLALDSVVGIPLSSQPPEIPPLRVRVQPRGSKTPSFAVVPGMRQLKKSRILSAVGNLDASQMAALDQAIREYLSD